MRSRQSYGMLRIINVLDTVADSTEGYITIAANLGNNPDYRANIQARKILPIFILIIFFSENS